jgi:hypothetical protein
MGISSELGPIDPQISFIEDGVPKRFSVHNLLHSYTDLFERAIQETGNLQPYLQQLANYDERDIQEYRAEIDLSEDIAVRTLAKGMMKDVPGSITEQIRIFLTPPERTKVHGRPIYRDEAAECGLGIESIGTKDRLWELLYELYLRTNNYVNTNVSKCVETRSHSFHAGVPTY